MREPPETSELIAFVRTVDLGSLSAAAVDLGQPRATVARRLERLEERLGTRLLRRTTRQVALTEAGRACLEFARESVRAATDAARAAVGQQDEVVGVLRVSVPPVQAEIAELLLGFHERFPRVQMEVMATSAYTDLVAGRYDVALRASSGPLPAGYVARILSRSRLSVVGSSAYFARAGRPTEVSALVGHACLVALRGDQPARAWPLRAGGDAPVNPVFAANDLALLMSAALADRGLALLPEALAGRHPSLERVLVDEVGTTAIVALLYPERAWMPAPVRAFIDYVTEVVRERGLLGQPGSA